MATKIVTKNSSTAGSAPSASDLVQGELAVNVADKRLYTEDNAGNIVELGTNPLGEITANGGIALGDNDKATFGASDDLQIYHDGSNSYVQDAGDGSLILNTTNGGGVYVYSAGETMATFNSNGAVNLYHDNLAKLATTSTGIDVTGTATMDGLTVDGDGLLYSASNVEMRGNANVRISLGTAGTSGANNSSNWIYGNGTNLRFNNAGGFYSWETIGTERMRIDSSGRVLVGITGASGFGTLESTDLAITGQCILARASGNVLVGTTSAYNYSGIAPLLTIDNHAGIGIRNVGSADAGYSTIPSGNHNYYAGYFLNSSGSGVGNISCTSSSTAYNTSSDYRLKENVVPMTGSIDRVKALKPSRFNFIVDADNTVDGFLAHEAQTVVPECVTGTKDAMRDEEYEVTAAVEEVRDEDDNITTEAVEAVMGTRSVPDMQGIDQAKLVPLLTAALQEAITKIESLTTRIAALEE